MFQPPDRRRIYLLRHAEAAYVDEQGNVTGCDLNKSTVHLTAMEQTAARIAELLDAQP